MKILVLAALVGAGWAAGMVVGQQSQPAARASLGVPLGAPAGPGRADAPADPGPARPGPTNPGPAF